MNISTQFDSFTKAAAIVRALWSTLRQVSTVVLLIGSIALVQAQNAAFAPLKAQNAPEALPTEPPASTAKPETASSAFSSYQRQTQPPSPPRYGFELGNRSFMNSFQPAASFSNLPGLTGSALDLNRTGGFGTTRQGAASFNQLGSFGMGRGRGDPGLLFQPSSATGGPFGVPPQPSLNQLMRGSFNLPLGSSPSSAFRFQYSNMLTPAGNLSDLAHPYGSLLFTSSDLGNGVFLSAGTYNGGHATAGAPTLPAGIGAGAPKHSASGVAIKLSF